MSKTYEIQYRIGFETDTAALKQQLGQVNQQLLAIGQNNGANALTPKMQQAAQAANELYVHLNQAVNVNTGKLDLSKFNQSLKASGMSLEQYRVKLSAIGQQGTQAFIGVAQSIAAADSPLRRTNAALDKMWTTMKNTARWQISSTALRALTTGVREAFDYAKDLNESLNNIRIVTGKNTEEMAKFAKEANKAAKALSSTTTDYTNASLIYYQQGLDGQDVKDRTDVTVKLANVTGESAETVSNWMTAVWNNFDDGSKSLEHYADVMTALGAATASSADEIAQGLEKFAAISDTVGLSYEYAAAALATVTAETRQSADVVGTAFKTIFARMEGLELGETLDDGTTLNKYSEALYAVGVNIKDNNGQLKDMDTILNEMGAKWSTISKDQQIALAQTVGGLRQYNQLIALMDNWDKVKENIDLANGATGTLTEQSEIYEESWEGASKRAKTAAQGIYDSLINDEGIIKLIDGFADFLGFIEKTIDAMGGFKGVLSGLSALLLTVYGDKIANSMRTMAYNIDVITGKEQQRTEALKQESLRQLELLKQSNQLNDSQLMRLDLLSSTGGQEYTKAVSAYEQMDTYSKQMVETQRVSLELAKDSANKEIERLETLNQETEALKDQISSRSNVSDSVALKDRPVVAAELQGNIDALGSASYDIGRIDEMVAGYQRLTDAQEKLKAKGAGLTDEEEKELKELDAQIKTTEQNMKSLVEELKKGEGPGQARRALNVGAGPKEQLKGYSTGAKNFRDKTVDEIAKDDRNTLDSKQLIKFTEASQKAGKQFTITGKAIDKTAKSVNDFSGAVKNQTKANKDWAGTLTAAFRSVSSLMMGLNSLSSIKNTLSDDTLSSWQKFTSIAMSLGMGVPMLISGFSGLIKTIASTTLIQKMFSAAQTETVAAIWAENKAITANQLAEKAGISVDQATIIMNRLKAQSLMEQIAGEGRLMTASTQRYLAEKLGISTDQVALMVSKMKQGATFAEAAAEVGLTGIKKKGIVATVAQTLANWGLNASMVPVLAITLILIAAIAALVAIVWLGVKAFQAWKASTPEGKLKAAEEKATKLAEALDKAKEASEKLKESFKGYKDALKALAECTKGTQEWNNALLEVNKSALSILENNPELWNMVDEYGNKAVIRDENGAIQIADWVQEQIQAQADQTVITAQAASYAANAEVREKKVDIKEQDLLNQEFEFQSGSYHKYAKEVLEAQEQDKDGILTPEEFESFLNTNYSTWSDNLVQGATKALPEILQTQAEIETQRENNRLQKEAENLALAQAQLGDQYSGGSDLEKAIVSSAARNLDDITEQKKAELDRWGKDGIYQSDGANAEAKKVWEEFQDITGQNLGKLTDTLGDDDNRIFQYKDAQGEIQEITLETMQAQRAAAEALEELGVSAKSAAEALGKLTAKEINGEGQSEGTINAILDFMDNRSLDNTNFSDFQELMGSMAWNTEEGTGQVEAFLAARGITSDKDAQDLGFEDLNDIVSSFNSAIVDMSEQMQRSKETLTGHNIINQDGSYSWQQGYMNQTQADKIVGGAGSTQDIAYITELFESGAISGAVKTEFLKGLDDASNDTEVQNLITKTIGKYGTEEMKFSAGRQRAETAGLDPEVVEAQARQLMKSTDAVKDNADAAMDLAIRNQKLNKGIDVLSDGWKDWDKQLRKTDKTTQDYAEAAVAATNAIAELFGISSEDIPSDFLEESENLDLITQAADGSAEAIAKLGMSLAKTQFEAFSFNDVLATLNENGEIVPTIDETAFNTAKQGVLDGINELQGKINEANNGQSLDELMGDPQKFINDLNNMAAATGMSVEQMKTKLAEMNIQAEVEPTTVTTQTKQPIYETKTTVTGSGYDKDNHYWSTSTSDTYIKGYKTIDETKTVANIKYGEDASTQPRIVLSAPTPSVTSGGKSGGGSKPKTKSNADIERYHVVDKKIEVQERLFASIEEQIEEVYSTSGLNAFSDALDNINSQLDLQNQKMQEAEGYLEDDIAAFEESGLKIDRDEAGNIKNWYELQQSLNEMYNAAGEERQEEIEKYYDILESIEDTISTIRDIEDAITDNIRKQVDLRYQKIEKTAEFYEKAADRQSRVYERQQGTQKRLWGESARAYNGVMLETTKKIAEQNNKELSALWDDIFGKDDSLTKKLSNAIGFEVQVDGISGDILNYEEINKVINENLSKHKVGSKEYEYWKELSLILQGLPDQLDAYQETNDKVIEGERQVSDQALANIESEIEGRNKLLELREREQELTNELFKLYNTNPFDLFAQEQRALISDIGNLHTTFENISSSLKSYQELLNDPNADQNTIKEAMQDLQEQFVEGTASLNEFIQTVQEMLPNAYEKANEEIEKFTQNLVHEQEVLEQINSIMTLMGGEKAERNWGIKDSQVQSAKAMLRSSKAQLIVTKEQLDLYKEQEEYWKTRDKDNYEAAVAQRQAAEKAMLEQGIASLEAAQDVYEKSLERSRIAFENILTDDIGFEMLQAKYDNFIQAEERYLDVVNSSYEINKWNRKLQDDIEKTTSAHAAKMLKNLQKEIDLRTKNGKLTQYDLDLLNAKYEITKAQIALEEAQNNKTTARLVRDASGNYTYRFTANEDKVSEAQQKLDDANNKWYNLTKEQIGTNINELIALQKSIAENATSANEDDRALAEEQLEQYEYLYSMLEKAGKDFLEAGGDEEYLKAMKSIIKPISTLRDTTKEFLENAQEYQEQRDKDMEEIEQLIGPGYTGEDVIERLNTESLKVEKNMDDKISEIRNFLNDMNESFSKATAMIKEIKEIVGKESKGFYEQYYDSLSEAGAEINWAREYLDAIEEGNIAKAEEALSRRDALLKEKPNASKVTNPELVVIGRIWNELNNQQKDELLELYNKGELNNAEGLSYLTNLVQAQKQANGLSGEALVALDEIADYSSEEANILKNKLLSGEISIKTILARLEEIRDELEAENNGTTTDRTQEYHQSQNAVVYQPGYAEQYEEDWGIPADYHEQMKNKMQGYATGGYTGAWGDSSGKLAVLHEKELVLNKEDTANILSSVGIVRNLNFNAIAQAIEKLTQVSGSLASSMLNGILGYQVGEKVIQQNVTIEASFPGVSSALEIEMALDNIVNDATQFATTPGF